MPYLFNHLESIETTLRQLPSALITDVDGTISQTAPTPEEAEVSPQCRHYLSLLCHRLFLVAAISGRPVTEVKEMVKVKRMVYIGNHGMEWWSGGRLKYVRGARKHQAVINRVLEELTPFLSQTGICTENKGITATIHYRLSPDPEAFRQKLVTALKKSPQTKYLRILPGKMSINILPLIAVNKGTAVTKLIGNYDLKGGTYLGDDITDIDAFRAIHAASESRGFHGFAIGITGPEMPEKLSAEADFTMNGINDVGHFLRWLTEITL